MFKIGEIEIHLINDSLTQVDAGGMFGLVPRVLWGRSYDYDQNNRITSNILCLLVKAAGKNIVVDTGWGFNKLDEKSVRKWQLTRPHGTLLDALARQGLAAEDIDIVFNTHLHSDHCHGNTTIGEDGEVLPTFPHARYLVQQREYEDAIQPNERTRATYLPVNFEPLAKSEQLELLDGDTQIVPGLRAVVTPGHTPGHMSALFESQGQTGMFLCDMASLAIHFERLGWMTAYDVEPLVTLETKRKWQAWALETNALLLVPHDVQKPVARLQRDEAGKLHMQAVEWEYA